MAAELVIFVVTGAVAVATALGMLLSPNAVHSALFLILNFAALAVLFLVLESPLLAVVQVTVYAGAIMVLFLFVVMLLGAERAEAASDELRWQRPLALLLGLVLIGEVVYVAVGRPGGFLEPAAAGAEALTSPRAFGQVLFNHYLLPFEVASVLLLVAMVGVIVLASRAPEPTPRVQRRTAEPRPDGPARPREERAAAGERG